MKTKTAKKRERALRLGLLDPTMTVGVARSEIASFYKRGGKTPTKKEKINRAERKHKAKLYA